MRKKDVRTGGGFIIGGIYTHHEQQLLLRPYQLREVHPVLLQRFQLARVAVERDVRTAQRLVFLSLSALVEYPNALRHLTALLLEVPH
jgi:hypothetical protein